MTKCIKLYVINIMRHKFQQLQIPGVMASIIVIVCCTNSVLLPTVTAGKSFIASLVKAVFLGMGVATGVSFFVIPISQRRVVKIEFTNYLTLMQKCITAQKALLQSLQEEESFKIMFGFGGKPLPQAAAVAQLTSAVVGLHAKLQIDLPLAKQEVGIGKMGPDELKQLNKLSRFVMLPLLGLGSVSDILKRFASARGWNKINEENLDEKDKAEIDRALREYTTNMRIVAGPIGEVVDLISDGLDHVLYQLEFKSRPKATNTTGGDEENVSDKTAPGSPGFAAYLDEKSNKFYSEKHLTLIEWGKARGIQFPDDFFDHPDTAEFLVSDEIKSQGEARRKQNQRQLYLLLYVSTTNIEYRRLALCSLR
jgi:6TM putative ER transporter